MIPWNKNPCFTGIFPPLTDLGLIFPCRSPLELHPCDSSAYHLLNAHCRAVPLTLTESDSCPFVKKPGKNLGAPNPKKTKKSGKWILKIPFTFWFGQFSSGNAWWDELKWIRFGRYSNRTPAVWTESFIHAFIPCPCCRQKTHKQQTRKEIYG